MHQAVDCGTLQELAKICRCHLPNVGEYFLQEKVYSSGAKTICSWWLPPLSAAAGVSGLNCCGYKNIQSRGSEIITAAEAKHP